MPPGPRARSLASPISWSIPPERFVEAVENRCPLRQAIRVDGRRQRQPDDHAPEPRRLRPAMAPILEVEVVNDFRDAPERRVAEPETLEQHFERAQLAFVRELGAGHVE